MSDSITLGTRGSDLALAQAMAAERALMAGFPGIMVVRKVIMTTGDRRTDVALNQVAKAEGGMDKGVFTKELENALDAGAIDLAVHSLKDVPTVLEPRFSIAAALKRAPVRDVLLTRDGTSLNTLPEGARVGTSSVRRARQLEWLRPDLRIVDLRGNVPTRLQKLVGDETYDAIMLAEAGLIRLGYLPSASASPIEALDGGIPLYGERLSEKHFHPAAAQGAIGLEIRTGDARAREMAEMIGDPDTWLRITAEREFLRLLDAGCSTPVGVYSFIDGGRLHLSARVFPEDGGDPRTAAIEACTSDPLQAALILFQSLV
jgi:hydroxymethylbilane synthase